MIDGGFLKKKYKQAFNKHLEASDMESLAKKLIKNATGKAPKDVSYRAYYYDCPPYGEKVEVPLSGGAEMDFSLGSAHEKLSKFLSEVKLLPFFAVREGFLSFEGWSLKPEAYKKKGGSITVSSSDFKVSLKQKGVDTKIGLDIAWVSYEKIASMIILVTGDSDFVPAVKTARRNGIFITLFSLHHGIKQNLKENVDVLIEDDLPKLIASK